jgi:Ca-activated chloride channel family protein
MDFAQPYYLICFIPLLLLGLLIYFLAWRKQAALNRLGAPQLIARLSASVNWRGRRWQTILWFAALALLILALARPRWGAQVEIVERQGVEIMVALDVSKSMLAEDLRPNRLARAKLEISELMDRLEGNELGLAVFAGAAYVQFPLTSDFSTARFFLEAARPEMISRTSTNLASAIEVAMSGFNEERASQQVIILLTDGEANEYSSEVLPMVEQAAEAGIIIHTIGFGSPEGEPIPEYDDLGNLTGYKQGRDGETVLSRLDETTLQEIANITNGRYFRASADGREVGYLVETINELQTSQLESRFETRGIERFQWFLLAAVVALIICELIPDRLGPKTLKPETSNIKTQHGYGDIMKFIQLLIFFVAVILLTACSESAASYNNAGNQEYANGKYAEALENYRQAHQLDPDLPHPYYNAGSAYHRQGNLKGAVAQIQQSIRAAERAGLPELEQPGHYNQGNNFFTAQNFGAAIDAYKESLRLKPDDADAKHNLELALKMLQQQQQQQPQSGNQSQQPQPGGGQPQQQPQQGQQGNQPQPPGGGQSPPQQQDQPGSGSQPQQQPGQTGELTPQEAEQLLDALGQNSQTLQERLNQTYGGGNNDGLGGAPKSLPPQDW